jgi:peptidoglycan/xylan/chitin deacetylase (PgdA/CDA1 family)
MTLSRRAWLSAALSAPLGAQEAPRRTVAVTLDDGPAVGDGRDLARFQAIVSGLIESLQAERVACTVFMNERQLQVDGQREQRAASVAQWLDAGFELGNHTYSHADLNRTPLHEYLDDIVRGEVVMRAMLAARGRKLEWFRHPYLHTGPTPEVHDAVQAFLKQRGYRVAPVTVDYADYSFAGAYSRALRGGETGRAAKIRQAYLDQVDAGFEHYEKMSMEVLGREPAQILLLHCNELNSVSLRESIARIRARGYAFVTLAEAMKDPAYERPDAAVGTGGMSWLRRWAIALGKPVDPERALRLPEGIR